MCWPVSDSEFLSPHAPPQAQREANRLSVPSSVIGIGVARGAWAGQRGLAQGQLVQHVRDHGHAGGGGLLGLAQGVGQFVHAGDADIEVELLDSLRDVAHRAMGEAAQLQRLAFRGGAIVGLDRKSVV